MITSYTEHKGKHLVKPIIASVSTEQQPIAAQKEQAPGNSNDTMIEFMQYRISVAKSE